MNRWKQFVALPFLLAMLLPAGGRAAGLDSFRFERMWPTLQQPWYFFGPSGVAIGPEGNVYVADSYVDRIRKFTEQGQFVSEWGTRGSREGEFEGPTAIAVDSGGFVYVVDRWNSRIQKFSADGTFVKAWGGFGSGNGEFAALRGVAADGAGHLYVTDTEYADGAVRTGAPRVQKFTTDGQFVTSWGGLGSGNGQFANPTAVAAGSDGYVYVTDTSNVENDDDPDSGLQLENHRVQKFDANGNFVTAWGGPGTAQGLFDRPEGIAVDAAGAVYVADASNNRVQKFSADGQFVRQWGLPSWMMDYHGYESGEVYFDEPVAIAVNARGTVYVAEISGQSVQSMTDEGTPLAAWGSGGAADGSFRTPRDLAVDADGYVYVADTYNARIQKFTASGQFVTKWGRPGEADGEFYSPSGIAVGPNGLLYVIDEQDKVQMFRSDGSFVGAWGSFGGGDGQFAGPLGIAIDGEGFVYVTDSEETDDSGTVENYRVQKFTAAGQFVTKWGSYGSGTGQFNPPMDVAVDAAGNVYVADAYNYRIQKFTSDGVFVKQWGSYGDYPGQFVDPVHIAAGPNGNLYVSDRWNYRIQEFTADGDFVAELGRLGSDPGMFSLVAGVAFGPDGRLFVCDEAYDRVQVFTSGSVSPGPGPGGKGEKAVIVAGSGPYQGNNLWDATQMNANHAYRTLIYQGYTKESIYYLSADTDLDLDGNGILDDVDGEATGANLRYALTQWAGDAETVAVYMVGHGGDGSFRIGETESLSAEDFASWIDLLQGGIAGPVLVVYDACESGSFVSPLASAAGSERIVVTSTAPGQSAYFINAGSISFSYTFWSQIFDGGNVYDAFVTAKNGINFAQGNQLPLIDDNGNGIGNEKGDGTLAAGTFLGLGVARAADLPFVGTVSVGGLSAGSSSATIRVENIVTSGSVSRVWAVITPPSFDPGSPETPVTSLPVVDLRPAGGSAYQVTYAGFSHVGTYHIAVFAMDDKGTISLPNDATVTQTEDLADPEVTLQARGDKDMVLTISLAPGGSNGTMADWWMVAATPEGLFYLELAGYRWEPWLPDLAATYTGPLFPLPAADLAGIAGLPDVAGTFTFYFGVDTPGNGGLDPNLFFDYVTVQRSGL